MKIFVIAYLAIGIWMAAAVAKYSTEVCPQDKITMADSVGMVIGWAVPFSAYLMGMRNTAQTCDDGQPYRVRVSHGQ